jgi:hypothetical protein
MTGKIRARLFLTNSENETILDIAEAIMESDFDTEEEMELGKKWAKLLYQLVFGKTWDGKTHYPVVLESIRDDESSD